MKVDDKGGIKLAKNEKRIGTSNFFIKEEENHMKIFDLNQVMTHRYLKDVAIGKYLEMCYKELSDESVCKALQNYVAVLWTVTCVVPDIDFLTEVYKSSEDCLNRHKEVYGVPKEAVSDEEDAKVIQEERDLRQFEDDVRNMPTEE